MIDSIIKVTLYTLLFFTIYGCTHRVTDNKILSTVTIDVDNTKALKLSELFSDVSYVLLSDSFLIGTVERAKIYGDKLFILANKSVLVFDINSGKSYLEIRHLGQGPGEYISLYDFLYDQNENTIELLDMNHKKVLIYGMDDKFINDFNTSFFSFSFHKIDHHTYLFYNNNMISDKTQHKLIRYDSQHKEVKANYFPIDKHLADYFFTVEANNFGSSIYPSFNFCPSDTIYGFTENYEPYGKYVIDFGKHHTPQQFYRNNFKDIFDFSVEAVQRGFIYAYDNFCENDSVIALSLRSDKKMYWALCNKNTKNVWTADKWLDDYHSNISIDISSDNCPVIIDNEYMYFFMQPEQLIDLMQHKAQQECNNILSDILHSPDFSEQSNPILVKCKFSKINIQ